MTKDDFLKEININCSLLWFIIDGFKDFINAHLGKPKNNIFLELIDITHSDYSFQSIRGFLKLSNGTRIIEQSSLIDSFFVSEITIDQVIFSNISSTLSIIRVMESKVIITNSSVISFYLNGLNSEAFLAASSSSEVIITNFIYTDNTASFVNILQSVLTLDGLTLKNVVCDYYVIKIDQG